jgi:hypothetical protein
MIQDRNVHRDSKFLRRTASGLWSTTQSQTDFDQPIFITQPQWNWRLTGLSGYASTLSGTVLIAAGAVRDRYAIGSPLMLPGVGVTTFLLDEFEQRRQSVPDNDVMRTFSGPSVQAFDDAFTITNGFWGVVLEVATHSGVGATSVSNIARSLLMEFPTEQDALDNCPQVPEGFGRVAILTIHAVGGDFIAGTTFTDAALVAAFNTFDQYGFSMLIDGTTSQLGDFYFNAGGADFLKDPSGAPILQGRGLAGPTQQPMDRSGDLLVVTLREVGGGVSQISDVRSQWQVDYRPFPVGGEGLGDVSVSQTPPSFVP